MKRCFLWKLLCHHDDEHDKRIIVLPKIVVFIKLIIIIDREWDDWGNSLFLTYSCKIQFRHKHSTSIPVGILFLQGN